MKFKYLVLQWCGNVLTSLHLQIGLALPESYYGSLVPGILKRFISKLDIVMDDKYKLMCWDNFLSTQVIISVLLKEVLVPI